MKRVQISNRQYLNFNLTENIKFIQRYNLFLCKDCWWKGELCNERRTTNTVSFSLSLSIVLSLSRIGPNEAQCIIICCALCFWFESICKLIWIKVLLHFLSHDTYTSRNSWHHHHTDQMGAFHGKFHDFERRICECGTSNKQYFDERIWVVITLYLLSHLLPC